MKMQNTKAIAIVGTTASGKTGLAVDLALEFAGEVVSADSRQVYKYMDIGTGKDLSEYVVERKDEKGRVKKIKVPYHMIDVVNPKDEFDLASWLAGAKAALKDIAMRHKLPIVAGGTGLYTEALVDGYKLSAVKPDFSRRKELEKMEAEELLTLLTKKNKAFATKLNQSERQNKRRLIRYIEINETETDFKSEKRRDQEDGFDYLLLGLTWPREILRERIYKRLIDRLENEDMVAEVLALREKHGVSWERIVKFGLEYKFIAWYLQEKIDYDEMVERLARAIGQFAKRQMTWLRRWERQGAKIHWIKNDKEAFILVREFLNAVK